MGTCLAFCTLNKEYSYSAFSTNTTKLLNQLESVCMTQLELTLC